MVRVEQEEPLDPVTWQPVGQEKVELLQDVAV
jgi:hypothetical protein